MGKTPQSLLVEREIEVYTKSIEWLERYFFPCARLIYKYNDWAKIIFVS